MSLWKGNFSDEPGPQGSLELLEQRVLPMAGALVPDARRQDWLKEWHAELWQLRHGHRRTSGLLGRCSLTYGLVADAAWLRMDGMRDSARGSAAACLITLVACCLLCATTERVVAGSWHGFFHELAAHLFGLFGFVAVPAVFASIATYPLRPLRCDRRHVRVEGVLSAWARWNLFLGAKVTLTLTLCLLASVVAAEPMRMAIGRCADWGELFFSSLVVTAGMRWALMNQEQRCQKCLRLLSEPTRVGIPSRNFLEWSGTELVCTEGHGLLHVPEMPGSWCWYDLWVELDAGWSGLFSS